MITVSKFVGRERQLNSLEEELDKEGPSLVMIYGRRRVGKSRLIVEAIKNRRAVYFQAQQATDGVNQENFKQDVSEELNEEFAEIVEGMSGWENIFKIIKQSTGEEPSESLTVVLDEFPYLCESNSSLPSVFQKIWDEIDRKGLNLNLIICGSQIAFMEEILSPKNPLYDSHTKKLNLQPMPYREMAKFFPNWTAQEIMYGFGVLGGIPHYSSLCDPEDSLRDNIIRLVLKEDSPLKEEPEQILQGELRQINRYSTVLRAIANGNTQWGKILNQVDFEGNQLPGYMKKLEELHLVFGRSSLEIENPEKKRNRRYYIQDPFFIFWFRFVSPHLSTINEGLGEQVYSEAIAPEINQYMGPLFEEIAIQWAKNYSEEKLGTAAGEVGQIWTGDFDIDVAGTLLNGEEFYGECKWWKEPVGKNVLESLEENINKTTYGKKSAPKHRLLFSRSGFTKELEEQAQKNKDLHLLTPEELI